MLETTRQNYKYIAIIVSTMAAGIPLWTYSQGTINFSDPYFIFRLYLIGFAASFFTLFIANLKMRDMISSFITGYVIAVILYFVSRILISNMIHTQFLLSLVVAIALGIATGFSGSVIWVFIKRKA